MPTLYQKYRPQRFADLAGQEHIVKTLTNEIINNKIAHAYLFYGARGIGKTTIARLLSKAINCQNRTESQAEPCNKCTSCQEINNGHNIDIIEIDAASHTGVDNVRENIIENAQFRPTKSKYKVFIIDEVHMLSTSAFNALLKTLEEPPQHAIFILATTELHKLPATIISRCQRFHFQKIGYKTMLDTLQSICKFEKVKVDKLVLEKIINKSDGALRDAQSLLGQILSLDKKEIKLEDAEIVLPSSNVQTILQLTQFILTELTDESLKIIDQQIEEGVNLDQFAYDLLEALRLMLLIKYNSTDTLITDYNPENYKKIKKLTDECESDQLVLLIEKLIARKAQIKSSPIPQLPLELFVVEATTHLNTETPKQINTTTLKDKDDVVIPTLTQPKEKSLRTSDSENSPPIATYRQKIKTKISNLKNKKINTTFEQIQAKWEEIKTKISEQNHTLSFILNMCDLDKLDKNKIRISVPYELHQNKLEEPTNKHIIESVIKEEFGEHISICCQIKEVEEVVNRDDINSLAAEFGGEVV